ncbi:MAG: type II secretion system protein [Rubrivivax sp.]|nr:MAG: type II secretion system protein [Rubrivivax sp.]
MRGFTMIEVIVVMLLISALGVLALPAFNSRTPLNQRGLRDQVGAMLEYSRKLAVVQQRSTCVLVAPPFVRAVYAPAPANVCAVARPIRQPADANAPFTIDIPFDVVTGGAALIQFDSTGRLISNVPLTITMGPLSVQVANETSLVTYLPPP